MDNKQHPEYPFGYPPAQQPIGERVAILETKLTELTNQLNDINTKLDSLLTLKDKGLGAIGLVTLLVGSGLIGVIYIVIQFFVKPHG